MTDVENTIEQSMTPLLAQFVVGTELQRMTGDWPPCFLRVETMCKVVKVRLRGAWVCVKGLHTVGAPLILA